MSDAARGFYVRKDDPLCPIYEVVEGGMKVAASRVGAIDHVYPSSGEALPDTLVHAGTTLEEAVAFAGPFYGYKSAKLTDREST